MSFSEARKNQFLLTVEQRQKQTEQQFLSACQSTSDVYANWLGYTNLETDETSLAVTYGEFSDANNAMIANVVNPLAIALDIIAGGTMDDNNVVLTRQDLLDMLAAAPTA